MPDEARTPEARLLTAKGAIADLVTDYEREIVDALNAAGEYDMVNDIRDAMTELRAAGKAFVRSLATPANDSRMVRPCDACGVQLTWDSATHAWLPYPGVAVKPHAHQPPAPSFRTIGGA